ncbi:hypothetical protein VFPFJ_00844 [Purpureocillium lilacinum]|uniref:Uncharacterized protein n=1 Tax=Purpureocillium lilacinum TaxID=33203 RepID=A0A179HW59_PURLI|nr:hypothetical protein VFPFJ_00844 [Purpureocillium lilacinum]OAQ94735.1 hypothetical protein VFPFJ_00844 [Purpureocillium lilacinum]
MFATLCECRTNPLDPLCRISRATRDHAATPPPQVANDLLPLRNDRRRQLLRRRAPAYPALPRAPDQVRRWGGHSGREREEEEVEEEGSRGKQGRNCTVQSDGRRRHIYQRGADDERVPRAEAGRHAGRMARLSQERRRDGEAMTTTGGTKTQDLQQMYNQCSNKHTQDPPGPNDCSVRAYAEVLCPVMERA